MRNLVPLSLFAAAASLVALDTPALHLDHSIASDHARIVSPAAASDDWRAHSLSHEPASLRLRVLPCERHASCIRRPMT